MNSGNFRIFEPIVRNLNLKSSDFSYKNHLQWCRIDDDFLFRNSSYGCWWQNRSKPSPTVAVLLVTSLCWWLMLTDFRCWWRNHYVGDFFCNVGDFLNVLNRSPTSWIGRKRLKLVINSFGLQHPSPTSM